MFMIQRNRFIRFPETTNALIKHNTVARLENLFMRLRCCSPLQQSRQMHKISWTGYTSNSLPEQEWKIKE